MSNLIPFPTSSGRDTEKEAVFYAEPARVVADISVSQANIERRRVFHATMQLIEAFGQDPKVDVSNRESIRMFLFFEITEVLKDIRYRLNFDTLSALKHLIDLIVDALIQAPDGKLAAPTNFQKQGNDAQFGEEAILKYVFSSGGSSESTPIDIKGKLHEWYLDLADSTWKNHRRSYEDYEYTCEQLAHIVPMVIDVIKKHMLIFRGISELDLPIVDTERPGQFTLF